MAEAESPAAAAAAPDSDNESCLSIKTASSIDLGPWCLPGAPGIPRSSGSRPLAGRRSSTSLARSDVRSFQRGTGMATSKQSQSGAPGDPGSPVPTPTSLDEEADIDEVVEISFDHEPERRRVLTGKAAFAVGALTITCYCTSTMSPTRSALPRATS
eukprot:gene20319-biopygen5572